MLTNVNVRNLDNPQLPRLDLSLVREGEYPIRYIDGLNPPKSNITTTEYAVGDGSTFQNARVSSRNIVLTVGFSPDYRRNDITQLRTNLHRHLPPNGRVRLVFSRAGGEDLYIDGVVESHESNIFGSDPASQISILCPEPLFKGDEQEVFLIIEFLEGGSRTTEPLEIEVLGDAPTGVSMSQVSYLWTEGIRAVWTMSLQSPSGNVADFVYDRSSFDNTHYTYMDLESYPRHKDLVTHGLYGELRRSLLGLVSNSSIWPTLYPGKNYLTISSNGNRYIGANYVRYTSSYWGV